MLIAPATAQTVPAGASVAAGSVTIAQPNATTLNITQSSQSAVVNYQSFSVGQGSSVNFAQPNSSSAILNRVTSNTPSTIAGQINANGQVYLVNPNGIAIMRSGTVNAGGGFVASTLGISDADFQSGKRTFTGNGASAGVSNAGAIRVGRGGYAALIGGTVSNSGSIDVPLGKVGLGSGERATLDFAGDGFLQVAVPTNAGGKRALVRNSGTIRADGGSVIISAATAREAARNAINISGTVQARSISGHNGSITIGGGQGGRIRITGRLIATSRHVHGGTINVTGRSIKLKGATVDASGKRGGGTINIGGGRQGSGPLQRADTTTIDSRTVIRADATSTGNGGNVVVWSDLLTTFAGTISARGGASSGNGGDAEVSGKAQLAYTGTTDLRAPYGVTGTLLLDPYNVIISNGTNNTGGSFDANANDSIINATTLSGALATANVTITTGAGGSQAGNITVNAPVNWSSNALLTLTAANAIAVNANITINGGGQLALNTATATANVQSAQPLLSFGSGASVIFATNANQGTQALTINTNSYTLVYTMAQLDAIDGQLATSGGGTVTPYGAGLGGRYALAGDLNATGTTYADAIVAGQNGFPSFSGTLEGLGHAVSNLTINSAYLAIGLIGILDSGGTVRDLGVAGGSISGNTPAGGSTGGLVGFNSGTITQSYAMGAVNNGRYIGGLVGANLGVGTITQSYATGTVGNNGVQNVGGLVGFNGGTITQSYATGAVSGVAGVGGLVGSNYGSIAQSYATGAVSVSGPGSVGGLVGYNQGGNPVQSYFDTQTTGQSSSAGGTGVTTATLANAATLAALNSGGVVWGNANNQTTPYLLNNIGPVLLASGGASTTSYTPILTQAGLEAVNRNTSANYVLANNVDLAGTTYGGAVIGNFYGTLDGLGNTINNLTINTPAGLNIGMIGTLGTGGTVRNVGMVGGSVSGPSNVGALVGTNDGTVAQSFATGTVTGDYAGGLVGYNRGTITQSYATGAVAGYYSGGLVGRSITGAVTQSFATGAVSGSVAGGLVGFGSGPVSQSYWDTQTSGRANGAGNGISTGITGLTTGQFQGTELGVPLNLGSGFAGGAIDRTFGLYPYLTVFYPTAPQAISGIAYSDRGVTPLASGAGGAQNVFVTIAGAQTAVSTGANGYYYTLVPSGTLAAPGTATLAYTTGNNAATGTVTGATLIAATGTTRHLDVWGNTLIAPTSATTLSAAPTTGALLFASNGNAALLGAASANNAALATGAGNLASAGYIATTASGFTVDAAVGSGASAGGLYVQTTQGPLTVSTAQALTGPTNLSLYAGGTLAINANITLSGAGLVSLDAGNRAINTSQGFLIANTLDMSFGNGASIDYGATDQGGRLSIGGSAYKLLYALASTGQSNAVQDIDTLNFFGNYALATNLTGTQTFTSALLGNNFQGFYGTLEGLGHTISNLTIMSSNANVGLVSMLGGGGGFSGTIRDIGLIGGTVTALTPASGTQYVGGLVGNSFGTITQVYSSATVNGTGIYTAGVGGLVGQVYTGSLTRSYATGAVNGSQYVGGLVGFMYGGLIGQSYATGAISGQSFGVGGVLGVAAGGAIDQTYASGAVSGPQNAGPGGLIGSSNAQVTNSYWDMQTSGQGVGLGGPPNAPQTGVTGLITADLQSGQATLLGSAFTSPAGLYPYLTNFFPGGVQAVSGVAYTNAGATPLSSGANGGVNVSVLGNGTTFGTASTGANGYYYVFGAAGSITSGASLLAYTQANNATGALNAATYTVAGTVPNNAGVNVYGGWKLDRPSSAITSLSALNAFEVTAAGSSPAATLVLNNRDIRIAAPSFSFDAPINLTGTLALNSTGTVTQASAGAVTLAALSLAGTGGNFTLTNAANAVGTIAANTGSVALTDSVALTTGSVTSTGNSTVTGVTTSGSLSLATSGNLTLATGAPVSGGSPVLSTAGAFINNAGSNGVVASTGRFLVWSQDPANDSVGGLPYAFKQYNATFGTTSVAGSGNGLLYTLAPTAEISAQASFDKIYDGSLTTRTLTSAGIYISSGEVAGDTVTAVTGATGTFGSKDVGNNIPVSIASSSLVFADAGGHPVYGYQISSAITGNITPKLISVNLMGGTSVYGSPPTSPVLSAYAPDLVGGDTVVLTAATFGGVGSNTPVGVRTVQATNISLVGITNYAVSNSGAAAQWIVTPRPLTITANAQNRAYGDANPALTYVVGGLGLVNGNTLTGALATSATTASNVGSYGITQGTLAASSNYNVTYVGANLGITARALSVTADPTSRIYGDTNPSLKYTVGGMGLVNGDVLSGSLATLATTVSNVGSYGITQGTFAASSNYNVTYVGANLGITARALSVTADPTSRIYGDTNPSLTYVVGGLGLVNGDTLSGGLATSATPASNAGSYGITQGTLAASSNYNVTYAGANLGVTARSLSVTADTKSRIYGDANTPLTYVVGGLGLVNGDTLSGGLATSATTASNVGGYGITQGTLTASSNYSVTYVGANLGVTARGLSVTANTQSRIYGDTNPSLTYVVGGLGLVDGDTLSGGLATSATTASNVGSYGITQGSLAASSNYTLTYVGANLGITARALSVTADPRSRIYGDTNPELTYTVGGMGLVNGDVLSGSLATLATPASNVGSYGITQGTLAASSNYSVTYAGAMLTVQPSVPPPVPPVAVIDTAVLASRLVRDHIDWIALPDNATPVLGAAPVATSFGIGVLYSDPRFDGVLICFGNGIGAAASCFAAGR